MKKVLKWFLITLAGLITAALVILSVLLSPRTLTKTANRLVADYVEGSASIGRIDVSVLKGFPDIAVSIDSIAVTYPHGTFAAFDSIPLPAGGTALLSAGRGTDTDTLITVNHLDAKLNAWTFIRHRTIRIPQVTLSGLRAFAHIYNDSTANWNIINLPESQDTASSPTTAIEAEGISIGDIQELVLTSPGDTLYAGAAFKTFNINGSFSLQEGQIGTSAELGIDGAVHFTNASLGTIEAPLSIIADASIALASSGKTDIEVKTLKARVAALPLEAEGVLKLSGDSTFVKAEAVVEDCHAGQLKEEYGRFLPGIAAPLKTDARITVRAEADGWFGSATGKLPLLKAEVTVPDSHISYEGLMEDGDFDLTFLAETDVKGRLNASLEDLCLDIKGISLKMSGRGDDLLGEDPKFKDIKAFACTEFADLVKYLPQESGIKASGDVDIELEGGFALSQLNPQNIHTSDLKGHIFSNGFSFSIPRDTLYAYASHPDIRLSTEGQRINVGAGIDSVRFIAGAATYIMGSSLALEANNHGRLMSDAGKIQPLFADLDIGSFNLRGTDSLTLGIRESCNKLTLGHIRKDGSVASDIGVESSNKLAYMHAGVNRITLADPDIKASLSKRQALRQGRRRSGRPTGERPLRDSLRRSERTVPDYLKEIDFRKKDLSIDIGEGLTDMFRKWQPSAEVSFSRGTIATPSLPLRNSITSFDATFDGDKLDLGNFLINSGTTTVGFRGAVSGLEPVLFGRKNASLNAVITIHSRMLNLNELLAALQAGSKLAPVAEEQDEYIVEGLAEAEEKLDFSAIIVPSNLNANLTVDIDSVRYSKLALGGFSSHVRMRERCVQLTNTTATSEFGSVNVDGFYSTVAKDDITAGFNVKLSSITADRIITLIPAVDSLVPMLKSFKGNLNCELAATTQLDQDMNILIPTISGAVKLNGSGLELSDTGDLRRIAQLLMFKDTKVGHIDDMSVNCIVADNQLEVFPFILGVDRYTLGLSGLQGFDQNFKYHISVIKSPLPFKFGVNLKGTFDDWKYTIGRAKYKSTSIPLFAPQVDTMQINLAASIKDIFRKGVDAAVREYAQERQRVNDMSEAYALYEDEEEKLSTEEMSQIDAYMLDMECEAETAAIEKEIEEMLGEEFMSSIMSELIENL